MKQEHIITVAALGPDSGEMLTVGALNAMKQAQALVLRTARHGAAETIEQAGLTYQTLDALYDLCEDFDELCSRAAQALIAKAVKRELGKV